MYVEYRAVSGVFQNIDPPHPSPTSECVLPRAVMGAGGSIFWKTPDIGLASYSIISLRTKITVKRQIRRGRVRYSSSRSTHIKGKKAQSWLGLSKLVLKIKAFMEIVLSSA
jgi:hypothetical protein